MVRRVKGVQKVTAKQFREMKNRSEYRDACYNRENPGALMELQAFEKWLDKDVRVIKGRKVPIGTTGTVFWIGMRNYSKYGYWWDWEVRVGIKTPEGDAYFTSENNIELVA